MSDELLRLASRVSMFGFEGGTPDAPVKRFLDEGLGAVILFGRNCVDGEDAVRLTAALAAHAGRPLLIATDQEGGSVIRIRRNGTLWPTAMGMGRLDHATIRELGRACGLELRAAGINMDLAPVADVNTRRNPGIGTRAFSERAEAAGPAVASWIEGLQSAGVAATVKHFPGLGGAAHDTHLERTVIDAPREALDARDLPPFVAAFAAGARAAMTSHSHYQGLDPDRPATISPAVLTALLRDTLRFDGVMVTDDLRMGAIAAVADEGEAAAAALAAGADMLLVCRGEDAQARARQGVVDAVRSGRLPRARLEQAAARVEALTAWAATHAAPAEPLARLHARHAPWVDGLCDRIVEVLRDRERLLPLAWRGPDVGILFPTLELHTPVEELITGEQELLDAWSAALGGAGVLRYHPELVDADAPELGAFLAAHPRRIVFTAEAHRLPNQARLVARSASAGTVLVALRTPHDAELTDRIGTALASYGYLPNALAAAGRALFGR